MPWPIAPADEFMGVCISSRLARGRPRARPHGVEEQPVSLLPAHLPLTGHRKRDGNGRGSLSDSDERERCVCLIILDDLGKHGDEGLEVSPGSCARRSDYTEALSGALQPVDKSRPGHAAELTAPSRRLPRRAAVGLPESAQVRSRSLCDYPSTTLHGFDIMKVRGAKPTNASPQHGTTRPSPRQTQRCEFRSANDSGFPRSRRQDRPAIRRLGKPHRSE